MQHFSMRLSPVAAMVLALVFLLIPATPTCLAAGLFNPAVNYPIGAPPAWISGGDFDGDGDIDLVTAMPNLHAVTVLFNDGFGVFTIAGIYPTGTQPVTVDVGDFDGDGDLDLVTANNGSNDVSVLFNFGAERSRALYSYQPVWLPGRSAVTISTPTATAT